MRISKIILAMVVCFGTISLLGQGVTTASINGTVTDDGGSTLPGAVVTAVHEPTGTRFSAVSRADGRYNIRSMRVGGPYTVSASMTGFATQKRDNVFLQLGEDETIDFKLSVESIEESLTVVASANPLINSSKTGASANISEESIQTLPALSRGIEDLARTSSYFNDFDSNGGVSSLSVAGRNNRYNNILIDGAVNNDLFGLAANGNPGGQAEAQPISLEAIQEVQLLIAPYDVRQGGFTGGGVNAVTKSGSNDYSGSVFHFFRDDAFVGDLDGREFGMFEETQTGASIGGPIMKDKVFFFASVELRRKDQPTGWAIRPDGDESGTGQNFGRYDEAVRFRDILINTYGYDPGGFEEQTRNTESDNFFIRFDFNLTPEHRLTLRHNYIDATNDILFPGSFTYNFPGNGYTFPNETNSTVAQLNSTFGDLYNEFRISYQTIKDRRTGVGDPFPWIEIENLPGGGEFEVGTERFSTKNALDQDVIEITDDLTFFRGNHTFTVGTHNELFSFKNLFIREAFGAYQFNSLEDFENGWVEQFDYSFSVTGDPNQAAEFDVQMLGFYFGDQWAVNPDLNVTMGLRLDIPNYPDKPSRNPLSEEFFGYRTDETADGNESWSPRVGFNWDILGDTVHQLRGGIGLFSGRTPYVWISNQYGNTGIDFRRVQARVSGGVSADNHIPFEPDPFNQPETIEGVRTLTNEIDLIDPNFEMPQLLRANVAYDTKLPFWDLIGTVEYMYSKTQNDILYQNLNLVDSGDRSFDGRPIYGRVNSDLTDVIFLTNHSEGDQQTINLKLERPMKDNWSGSVSYLNGKSETLNDGTSSQAVSNWRFNEVTGDPNNPPVAPSDYDVEHRFTATFAYLFPTNTLVSVYYNAQSGRPYSTTFNGDLNGDGQFSNDLLYVPNSADEVIIDRGTWDEFNAYIEADEGLRNARGSIVERNASREPWRRTMDVRVAQDVKFGRYKFQITADIFNFWNLIDDNSGQVRYVRNNAVAPISYRGIDDDTGKPIYRIQFSDPDARFQTDDLRSRWRGQLGLRFSF